MKKLGEGWQYTAYDLGNGRVMKKYHSWFKSAWVLLKKTFFLSEYPLWGIPNQIRAMEEKAKDSFGVLGRHEIPQWWIGNPRFLGGFDFEQDKAKPLHAMFDLVEVEEAKQIIDQFVLFNKKCLELGFIDKSFNITKNYGIDNNGNIVLIDIGELFDDSEKIQKQIQNRAWNKYYVAGCIKDEFVRKYFVEQMDKHFGADRTMPRTIL